MSVTTSNDGTYQESETGPSPFTRIVQQTKIGGTGFKTSSYLRLGGYYASEEKALLPPDPEVWNSTVSVESYSSSQSYLSASLLSSEGSGSVTTAQAGDYNNSGSDLSKDNTQTQNLQSAKATTSKTPRTPLKSGILMYSDQDLQINTSGAAYMEFMAGHSTYVKAGDSDYMASNGQMKMQGNLGLTIQAGVPVVETQADMQTMANARARADGTATYNTATRKVWNRGVAHTETYNTTQIDVPISYKGNTSSTPMPADLSIIASNNISQKAYGPLDEITYGDAYKNVHGKSTDIFYGTSYKETHGTATEMFYASKQTWIIDDDVTGKMAASLSMFLGISTTLNLSLTLGIALSGKLDTVIGADTKVVLGFSGKTVVGLDASLITAGLKSVMADDTKIVAGVDFKQATLDSKIVEAKLEKVGVDMSSKTFQCTSSTIDAKIKSIQSKIKDFEAEIITETKVVV